MVRETAYRRWTRATMRAAIRKWKRKVGEWPRQSDWDSAAMRAAIDRHMEIAADWGVRLNEYQSSDEWPPARHVATVFGTFNQAIRDAGGVPRAQGQHTSRGATPSLRSAVFGHVIIPFYVAEREGDERAARRALRRIAEVASKLATGLSDDELVEYAFEVMT